MSAQQTVLITGANRGLGLGLAREFSKLGWQVFGGTRSAGEAACEGVKWLELDVCSAASIRAACETLARELPSLDVLVNNAGINRGPREATVETVDLEEVARTIDVNALGPLRMLRATAALLRQSPNPRVVNISSGAGSLAHNSVKSGMTAYCVSKAALNMVTRRAALELHGITVVSVSPGWIRTDMGGPGASLDIDEAAVPLASAIASLKPERNGQWLDRFGNPSEYEW